MSVMLLMGDVAALWTQYSKESDLYLHLVSSRKRNRSKLSRGMDSIQSVLDNLASLLSEIAALTMLRSALLTTAGVQCLNTKLQKVTYLATALPRVKRKIRDVLPRLQVRNA